MDYREHGGWPLFTRLPGSSLLGNCASGVWGSRKLSISPDRPGRGLPSEFLCDGVARCLLLGYSTGAKRCLAPVSCARGYPYRTGAMGTILRGRSPRKDPGSLDNPAPIMLLVTRPCPPPPDRRTPRCRPRPSPWRLPAVLCQPPDQGS